MVGNIYDYLTQYDGLPPEEAVLKAWALSGGDTPALHETVKARVRETMPLLARSLDRLVEKGDLNAIKPSTIRSRNYS